MAVAAGVLLLTSGCVARTGEPPTASTTTTTTTTSRPTAVTEDPAIAIEAAELIASRDADRFNARICPGSNEIAPVTAIPADFANTRPAGVDTYELFSNAGDIAARLTVQPGRDLMLILGLDFETYEWCAYGIAWCPLGFTGLPPLTATDDGITLEIDQRRLCGQ